MPSAIESYLNGVYESTLDLGNTKNVLDFIDKFIFTPKFLPIVNKYKARITSICAKYPKICVMPKILTNPKDAVDVYNDYHITVFYLGYNYDAYDEEETAESERAWSISLDKLNDELDDIAEKIIADAKNAGLTLSNACEPGIDDRAYLMEFIIPISVVKEIARKEGYDIKASSNFKIKAAGRTDMKYKRYRPISGVLEGVGLAIVGTFGAILAASWIYDKVTNAAFMHNAKTHIDRDPHPLHTMITSPSEKEKVFQLTKNARKKPEDKEKRREYMKSIGYRSTYGGYMKLMLVNTGDDNWMNEGYVTPEDIPIAISEISDHIENASMYRYSKLDIEFFKRFLSDLNKAQEEKKGLLITD